VNTDDSFTDLLARIEALLRRSGKAPLQSNGSLISFGSVIVDLHREEVLRDGLPIALTAREFKLQLFRVAPPRENLPRRAPQ
jgi:DNA-binding response OmpR family regulator